MPVSYIDTSAFLKLLVEEEHSAAMRRYAAEHALWSSTLLAVESHRAGPRLGIDQQVMDEALNVVTMFVPSESTYNSARKVGVRELRTLDALHLASALELSEDLTAVITYDRRLAAGCEHEEVDVSTPGLGERWWQ